MNKTAHLVNRDTEKKGAPQYVLRIYPRDPGTPTRSDSTDTFNLQCPGVPT